MGPENAKAVILEFSDFQCPFCAAVQQPLHNLRLKYPDQLKIVYRHFPLEAIHPYALTAALAAECAGEQGAFEAFHDSLFDDQASIGSRAWEDVARASGVRDSAGFRSCMSTRRLLPRVREDARVAREIALPGTPGIIVNGVLLPDTPSEAELERYVRAALTGRKAPSS
jgi:protein-disulfide isomerase